MCKKPRIGGESRKNQLNGETGPGKSSRSNAESKSVPVAGSIVNNFDTENFRGTENLCDDA